MRKIDHKKIIKKFENDISELWQYFSDVERYIIMQNPSRKDLLIGHLSEQVFVSMAVLFEQFISDIFVAYINNNSQQFSSYVCTSVQNDLSNNSVKQFVNVSIPTNLNVAQIRELLMPDDDNIKFADCKILKKKAKQWLVEEHARKFSKLHRDDISLINSIKKIRNYLAHRSPRSLKSMISILKEIETASPTCKNYGLGINLRAKNRDIGNYLKADIEDGRRVEVYLQRIHSIALTFM
ncbi:hypothetical protein [Paenibacillus sp. NPDC058177]|uniref:hypothetical protein n=1 Tax=Paenibacillus sp. NPDC058177 TaxID=3346369 RepID=UPI0036DC266F